MSPDLFHRNRRARTPDGLAHYCKLCVRGFRCQTYDRRRETEIAYARAWQAGHPEQTRAAQRRAHRVHRMSRQMARETACQQREERAG